MEYLQVIVAAIIFVAMAYFVYTRITKANNSSGTGGSGGGDGREPPTNNDPQ